MAMGSINIVTDQNMLYNIVNQQDKSVKLRVLTLSKDANLSMFNPSDATIFNPPFQASNALVNGDINSFVNIYYQYLGSSELDQYINILIRTLMNGVNLILYVDNDSYEFYFKYLYNYLVQTYGLYLGTPQNSFNINPQYFPTIYTKMYLYTLLTYDEYMQLYPYEISLPMDINVIEKMKHDSGVMISSKNSQENFLRYFNTIKNSYKEIPSLSNPFNRGDK